jgi:hypothetical protein
MAMDVIMNRRQHSQPDQTQRQVEEVGWAGGPSSKTWNLVKDLLHHLRMEIPGDKSRLFRRTDIEVVFVKR